MTTPENRVKAKINKALKTLPRLFKYMPVSTGMGRATLDYLVCFHGIFLGIEAKKDANAELTPRQMTTVNELLTAGAAVYVIYDDESLLEMMNDLDALPIGRYTDTIPINLKNPAWQVRKNLIGV